MEIPDLGHYFPTGFQCFESKYDTNLLTKHKFLLKSQFKIRCWNSKFWSLISNFLNFASQTCFLFYSFFYSSTVFSVDFSKTKTVEFYGTDNRLSNTERISQIAYTILVAETWYPCSKRDRSSTLTSLRMCLGDPKYRSNLFQWTNTRGVGRLAACRNHFLWPLSAHFQEGAENQPNPSTFFETQVILRVSYRFVSSINRPTPRVLTPSKDFWSQNIAGRL